ncbi:MAG: DEAD/DEAH box helicase family protein [Rhodocyclaceae bacterium]|nr:DEAD/DEAH box helicase family protein [Rhodocyclaceae bacterium]
MSRIPPLPFQREQIEALVARFAATKDVYDRLGPRAPEASRRRAREASACVLLNAPTGSGKTLIAIETLAAFSERDDVVWFWFAPFAGLVRQAAQAIQSQSPRLAVRSLEHDRTADKLAAGAVFVLTWQTVAAKNAESRLARQTGDAGLSVDDLLAAARRFGFRIGAVVDEAHHGFVKAREAHRFFQETLAPDYALLMTATPRDADVARFSELSGYRVGGPEEWATISRRDGVAAGILKKGVKAARFIAKNGDEAQLVDFEEIALSEAAAMHRRIARTLTNCGIGLTPLLLVQVPDGKAAIEKARRYLIDTLGFREQAVRVHTADEPDANLLALAHDPAVEVLLFKMAVALGFDAPRAFVLAALRGARDPAFGVQVVGRLLRVPAPLQGRLDELPPELGFGYVYLANSEAQEGLTRAADAINRLDTRLATEAQTAQTVVTVFAGEAQVQVVRPGENLSLLPATPSDTTAPALAVGTPALAAAETLPLFAELAPDSLLHGPSAEDSPLVRNFTADAARRHVYPLRAGAPASFITECLPERPEDFDERFAMHVDFTPVLADRDRSRTRLIERTVDLFSTAVPEDEDVWAHLSVEAIALKAQQIAFAFEGIDPRAFWRALRERLAKTLEERGHELPDDEGLSQQLELLLVRHPELLKKAWLACRAQHVTTLPAHLAPALVSDWPLETAARNVYGVFPDDLNGDERALAELLDTAPEILWWHRNPGHAPQTVRLYSWAGGRGFWPDFAVVVSGRTAGEGVALIEVKGEHLQEFDRAKAGARHPVYGRVFMVGRRRGVEGFRFWRLTAQDELVDDGPFEAARLRYD